LLAVDEVVPRRRREVATFGEFSGAAFQALVGRSSVVEVIAVTLPEFADGAGRDAYLKSLSDAARRGAEVWLALLCPESDAALRMAGELRETRPGFLGALEESLWALYEWQRGVNALVGGAGRPGRPVEVVLYSQPFGRPPLPTLAPHYVFDDTLVTVPMPTVAPDDRVYTRCPVDHRFALPFGMYRELIRARHTPLEKHILDRVVLDLDGGPDLPGVKFVRHEGVKYLAVRDREAVTRLSDARHVGVFHGAGERVVYRPTLVHEASDGHLINALDGLVAAKYGCAAVGGPGDERCFYFRLEGYEV
jgi:hypothetical protein